MSFLDQVELNPIPDSLTDGTPFTMTNLSIGPIISTKFGDTTPSMIEVDGDATYSIFGEGILRQAKQAKPEDFPIEVCIVTKLTKSNRPVKLIVRASDAPSAIAKTDDDIPF